MRTQFRLVEASTREFLKTIEAAVSDGAFSRLDLEHVITSLRIVGANALSAIDYLNEFDNLPTRRIHDTISRQHDTVEAHLLNTIIVRATRTLRAVPKPSQARDASKCDEPPLLEAAQMIGTALTLLENAGFSDPAKDAVWAFHDGLRRVGGDPDYPNE